MYTISKAPQGVILTCKNCIHIESVSQFSLSLGSPRTQAARAMQAHSRDKHPPRPRKLLTKKHEVLASAAVSRHMWVCDR
jgi:hypothetical protein